MTRFRSLLVALLFAATALVATSVVHHMGEARAQRVLQAHHR